MLLILVVVLGGVAVGGYYAFAGRGGGGALERGIQDYNNRQREAAVGEFNKAVRDNPKDPVPHVYLARMAREVGNFSMATQELQLALQADPNNALALREMGANLLTQGNYDLARRFYVRAAQADPTDKSAQGYLGCTLMRLGRTTEAATFLNRAGPGPWSSCTPVNPMPPGMPGAMPPGAVPPAGAGIPPRP
jgi:Flp pilus assembly protein TadD